MPMANAVGGPQPTEARQGRHKQRYGENGERLVAGCIPIRMSGDGAEGVEVLLVSSRGGKGFCLPKGGWEDDESVDNAAKRETVEEAGVRGSLEEPMLGTFAFSSGKASPDTRHQGKCIAYVFVMHVAEELEVWPEGHERKRIWCPLSAASAMFRYEWMRQALNAWIERKGWTHLLVQQQVQQQDVGQQGQGQQQQQQGFISVGSDLSELSDSLDLSTRPWGVSLDSSGASLRGTSPDSPGCQGKSTT